MGYTNQDPGCCCGGGTPTCSCSPCAIPESNLTLSYTASAFGPGSIPLLYSGNCTTGWDTGCTDVNGNFSLAFDFHFGCAGGLEFIMNLYGSVPCGTGGTGHQICNTANAFTLTSYTCSPFSMTFTLNGGAPFYCQVPSFLTFTVSL